MQISPRSALEVEASWVEKDEEEEVGEDEVGEGGI
jgi:hypothetical protein